MYSISAETKPLERHVLSAKWTRTRSGDLILVNARPYANTAHGTAPSLRHLSLDELFLRPVADLSTSIELLLIDPSTWDTVATFDGHYAFTTKECPFKIFADDCSNADFLASGGEDGSTCIWHRRHRRLLRRLQGHTASVNVVSF